MKQYIWQKLFDLQFYVLTDCPESVFAARVLDLVQTLQDSGLSIHDAVSGRSLPIYDHWNADVLEAMLLIAQSAPA